MSFYTVVIPARTQVEKRPAGTYARGILNRLLIDLSWSSSRKKRRKGDRFIFHRYWPNFRVVNVKKNKSVPFSPFSFSPFSPFGKLILNNSISSEQFCSKNLALIDISLNQTTGE